MVSMAYGPDLGHADHVISGSHYILKRGVRVRRARYKQFRLEPSENPHMKAFLSEAYLKMQKN